MAQLRADMENRQADTTYKVALARSEPYKVMGDAVGATAAIFGTLFGVFGYILGKGH